MAIFAVWWPARAAGVAFFTIAHLVVLTALVTSHLGALLEQGPQGEELGGIYRESPEGRRADTAIYVLGWPIAEPLWSLQRTMPGSIARSAPWRVIRAAGFLANSVVWGIGVWLLVEGFVRTGLRLVRGRRKQAV